ncbi:hypothetical protein D3C73_1519230 [compost metagenome]
MASYTAKAQDDLIEVYRCGHVVGGNTYVGKAIAHVCMVPISEVSIPRRSRKVSASRKVRASKVKVGFAQPTVGKTLPLIM